MSAVKYSSPTAKAQMDKESPKLKNSVLQSSDPTLIKLTRTSSSKSSGSLEDFRPGLKWAEWSPQINSLMLTNLAGANKMT